MTYGIDKIMVIYTHTFIFCGLEVVKGKQNNDTENADKHQCTKYRKEGCSRIIKPFSQKVCECNSGPSEINMYFNQLSVAKLLLYKTAQRTENQQHMFRKVRHLRILFYLKL